MFSLLGIFEKENGNNSPSTTKCSDFFPFRISKIPLKTEPELTTHFPSSIKKERKKKKVKTLIQTRFKKKIKMPSSTKKFRFVFTKCTSYTFGLNNNRNSRNKRNK
jgi:hypothetical protein